MGMNPSTSQRPTTTTSQTAPTKPASQPHLSKPEASNASPKATAEPLVFGQAERPIGGKSPSDSRRGSDRASASASAWLQESHQSNARDPAPDHLVANAPPAVSRSGSRRNTDAQQHSASERRSVSIALSSVSVPQPARDGDSDEEDAPAEDLFSRSVKAIVAKSRSQSFSASADQDALVRRLVASTEDPTRAVSVVEGTDADVPASPGIGSRKGSLFRKLSTLSAKAGGSRLAAIVGDSIEALGDGEPKGQSSKNEDLQKSPENMQISAPTAAVPVSNYVFGAQPAAAIVLNMASEDAETHQMKTVNGTRGRSRSSSVELAGKEAGATSSMPVDEKPKLTRQRSASANPETGFLTGHRASLATAGIRPRSGSGGSADATSVQDPGATAAVSFFSRLPVSATLSRYGSTHATISSVKLRVLHARGEATFKVSGDATFEQVVREGILRGAVLPHTSYFKIRPVGVEAWEYLPGDKVKIACEPGDSAIAGLPPLPGNRDNEVVVSVKVSFHRRDFDVEDLVGR
ncbi:hypothetical protein HDU93_002239 [Gonapodya sp. JEL0774]|nr:hypothetical protein HDU93_002239 [Gonapodya sp. JEL0774]